MARTHRRSRFPGFPSFLQIDLGHGAVLCASQAAPAEESDAHVRAAEFRFPLLKRGAVVTTTVSNENSANALVFSDYAVTVNYLGKESQTQVVVHTVWVDAGKMPPGGDLPREWLRKMKVLCNVQVVGVIAQPETAGGKRKPGKRRRR